MPLWVLGFLIVTVAETQARFPWLGWGRQSREHPAPGYVVSSAAEAPPAARRDRPVYGDGLDIDTLEQLVFDCVNRERARHRLRPFAPDHSLQKVARLHSLDMAARNYFSHESRRGLMRQTSFGDRMRGNGVRAPRLAENIAMLPLVRSRRTTFRTDDYGRRATQVEEDRLGYQQLAQWGVQQWMDSPGHRKNILNPALETMGIGAALGQRDGEDYVYLTQDFGGR